MFSITIPNELSEIDGVIVGMEQFTQDKTIPDIIMQKLSIALDDLLNNIISYGYQDDEAHEITVVVDYTVDDVTVTIEDDGIPFNPFTVDDPDISLSLDERKIGGLGIHLVKNMMDEVFYTRVTNMNIVRLVKKMATGEKIDGYCD